MRRLRRTRGLTQARVAETLGISAPYLNLIEHNKRSVTAELLLKIADLFGLELNDLMSGDDTQLFTDLMETLGDPILAEQDVTNFDVRDLVSAHPVVARAMLSLYDVLRKSRTDLATLAERLESVGDDFADVDPSMLPADMVSDFIQSHNNYFPQLEAVAAEVRAASSIDDDPYQGLIDYIETTFDGIRVVILPSATMNVQHGTVRKFDPVMRTLMISELLPRSSAKFQIAHQLGLIVANDQIEALLDEGGLARGDSMALGRVALSNYFAAALLMPYGPFLEAARGMRYDIEMLEHRFDVSFEQVCHRLTTLSKSGAKGGFHFTCCVSI